MTADHPNALRTWRYVAETPQGETLKGELRARTEAEISRLVRQMGARPVEIRPASASLSLFSPGTSRLSRQEMELFSRGLADLLEAGIPLVDAVQSLARSQRRRRLKAFLERLASRLMGGESLADALAQDPADLPRLLIGLVRAGEESGALAGVMLQYADKIERENALQQELSGQMAYPALVSVMIVLTLAFLAWFVLPIFEGIFDDGGSQAPASTQFVLDAGAFVRSYGIWIPPAAILLLMALKAAVEVNGERVGQVIRAMPVIGPISRQLLADKYLGALGFLVSSGAPVARAEQIAREGLESDDVRAQLERASVLLKSGHGLSEALATTGLFDDEVLHLAQMGEKSGQLGAMLTRAASLSQKSYSRVSMRLLEIIGPTMIALLGLVVCGVIVSVMVGILSLNEAVY